MSIYSNESHAFLKIRYQETAENKYKYFAVLPDGGGGGGHGADYVYMVVVVVRYVLCVWPVVLVPSS